MSESSGNGNGNGNGRNGEMVRWIAGILLAWLVSYYASDRDTASRVTGIDTREQSRFEETQRSLARIEVSLRQYEVEIRRMVREEIREGTER